MTIDESLGPTKYSIIEAELVLLGLHSQLALIQHHIKFVEDHGNQFGILVPDVSQVK